MRRTSFSETNCSIAQALEVIGEWWTPMILRDAFLGVTKFDEFQSRLGIARNILTVRLNALVDHGVMERRCYDEERERFEYVLTKKGRALWPVMVSLRQWGDEWITGKGNEPILTVHKTCGHTTGLHMCCDACGAKVSARDLRTIPGPGAD